MNIHPKVAWGTIAALVWSVICLGLQQYAPGYEPGAPLATAVGALISGLAGWSAPPPSPEPKPSVIVPPT